MDSSDEESPSPPATRIFDRHFNIIGRIEDMATILQPVCNANALVFLDINIGGEYAGRMILELRTDAVPKTSENFRSLCTGERGSGAFGEPLHYKKTKFFKVTSNYACGGDVVKDDGSGGESIYGTTFADENRLFKHDAGVISTKSYGLPNSNNSQFILTCEPAPELDRSYSVVFGRILRGLPILYEMQRVSENNEPKEEILIRNCGELKTTDEWGFCEFDTPNYPLPPYPRDWDLKLDDYKTVDLLEILCDIREAGNGAYRSNMLGKARRKYRKAIRYYNFFMTRGKWENFEYFAIPENDLNSMHEFASVNYSNMAAVEMKLHKFENAIYYCTETIYLGKHCCKAYFRRGQAYYCLRRYAEAVRDFSRSALLNPSNKQIQNELTRAKDRLAKSRAAHLSRMERLVDDILEDVVEEEEEELERELEAIDREAAYNLRMASPTESSEAL
ncbi:peptidyl-prolyl cis-trans isomerase D [Ceratitis capitata]|uniref:(Mediterranean fruit fly) hypothetical protein n=1 Tax=Ceratitis capitata TaxID=7213 RepID=A0A811UWA4_CERCA|nr:peptidyl-prolyl cis-trans isomerase D [Ceratitis capitata]CAD7002951.1 unnamed protein product [Ceratitis capitata]